jgi:hypothetical protein
MGAVWRMGWDKNGLREKILEKKFHPIIRGCAAFRAPPPPDNGEVLN